MNIKTRIDALLNDPQARGFFVANSVIALIALLSLLLAFGAFFPYFDRYELFLHRIDWVTTVFFTTEYMVRFWIAEKKWAYARSPLGLIDLASFVPTYLGLGNFGFLKAARFIRITRLSRIANVTNVTKVVSKKDESTNQPDVV